MELDAAPPASLSRVIDEAVVTVSVAATFVASVPLCAIQGIWLVVWSPVLFFIIWPLAFLAVYPFVCALLGTRYLLASPDDSVKPKAGERMEAVTVAAGAFGVLCVAALTFFLGVGSVAANVSVGVLAVTGMGMLACLLWYAIARFASGAGRSSMLAVAALAALIATSTVFGFVVTDEAGLAWRVLALMYPINLSLVLAKLVRRLLRVERG